MKTTVYNFNNKTAVKEIELNDDMFGTKWNADLVHQVVMAYQANKRKPWAHAKGRGEVRGGGRKPWKQKGTGRARHGSIRSPIWKGGGKSHGPVKERLYEKTIPSKMKKAALYSGLSKKFADKELFVVSVFPTDILKTKDWHGQLKSFFPGKKINTLLVAQSQQKTIFKGVRNIPKVQAVRASDLHVLNVLKHHYVVIEEGALSNIP